MSVGEISPQVPEPSLSWHGLHSIYEAGEADNASTS